MPGGLQRLCQETVRKIGELKERTGGIRDAGDIAGGKGTEETDRAKGGRPRATETLRQTLCVIGGRLLCTRNPGNLPAWGTTCAAFLPETLTPGFPGVFLPALIHVFVIMLRTLTWTGSILPPSLSGRKLMISVESRSRSFPRQDRMIRR